VQSAHIRAVMLSIVLVSGMFILNVGVEEAFAEKGGNDKAKGEPKGCDNNKGKDKEQNPNCKNGPPPPPPCGSDPNDCDGDGVPNAFEEAIPCLDPFNPDSDGDGFSDGVELDAGSDPCSAASTP